MQRYSDFEEMLLAFNVAVVETHGSFSVPLETDASYECPSCSETNYVGVDPAGGRRQRFVEDCPVCCRPIEFEIAIDPDGDAMVLRADPAD